MPGWLRAHLLINRTTLTLAVIVAVTAMFVSGVEILDRFELRTYDLRFVARGAVPTSGAIVLAMVDEKSLDEEGKWPWPRAKFAQLIDRLSDDGAKVIAFDIGFLEPDENSQLKLLAELDSALGDKAAGDPKLNAFLAEARRHADNDRALVESMQRSNARIVLGYFFHMVGSGSDYTMSREDAADHFRRIDGSKYPLVRYRGGTAGADLVPQAYAPESNLEVLSATAASSGYFSVRPDADGVIRWMPLTVRGGEEQYPPLSLLAVWHYVGEPPLTVGIGPYGVESVGLGDLKVPTDEHGRLLINYVGPPNTFPKISICDVLDGRVPAGTFRDKIVLVGADATGIYDSRTTPFSPVHPGAEIHASVMDNLITGRFVERPGWSEAYDVFAIIVLSIVAGLGLWRLSPLPSVFFVAGLFTLHVMVARTLFARYGVWLNVVYPLLALIAVYVSITVYEFLTERRDRRRLRGAFSQYVAPEVVEQIVENPSQLELGGEEKQLTVLFSDLEGFTSYSERYTPQQMIELLSDYYAEMTECVFHRGGTLKEYVGDELMAIFGAPLEQPDHAVRACHAALEMREHRRVLGEAWTAQGRPRLKARTGINTGRMLVGNLGSKYRFSYGVLGDNVNLGSRLEGMNKAYRTEILIGENTVEVIGDDFVLREVDAVRVVGKQKPTRIFELVAESAASLSAMEARLIDNYASGLAAFRARRWDEALRAFANALALSPEDGPSQVMIERCREYIDAPPPDDWDGVFTATRK